MSMLDRILRGKIKQGSLTILSQNGEASHYGERQSGWPDVTMRIQSSSAVSRILLNPRLGMGEGNPDGLHEFREEAEGKATGEPSFGWARNAD